MPTLSKSVIEPWLSVIVPVYREPEGDLLSLFSWIEHIEAGGLQWIISCAENDDTAKVVQSLSVNSSSQLKLLVIESAKGRSTQMNAGARLAQGQVLLFLHADTRLDDNWPGAIQNAWSQGSVIWGAFSPKIDTNRIFYRIAEFWGGWRSQLLGLPYGDQAIFITKEQFWELGGFDEKVQFMEDVDLANRLCRLGIRPHLLKETAKTSSRRWEKCGLRQSGKNLAAFLMYCAGVSRSLIERWYQRA